MKKHLIFRLYGAMASWGEPAVGGDRPTALNPRRSAILGLLASAMGISRDNEERLAALNSSVFFGVKQIAPTSLLRDYHTVQSPSRNNKIVFRTRKMELDQPKLNTVLSSRDYRCDGLWVIAIWLSDRATISLEELSSCLEKPTYQLYLGRKSCPIAAPLQPQIVQSKNLKEALDSAFHPVGYSDASDAYWLGFDKDRSKATYLWEQNANLLGVPEQKVITTHPWDQPLNRSRWQFASRIQYQFSS